MEAKLRAIVAGATGLLCLVGSACIPRQPDMSDYMFQQMQQGKPIVSQLGKRIDEAQAKNIQTGIHTKQDIEMWFGKALMAYPITRQDPHGCTEGWSYNHMATVSNPNVGGTQHMGMESLAVLFKADGKVCRWSLTRKLTDMNNPTSMLGGRPVDTEKTKSIQYGVQTKQDIETWFGKPTAIGVGDQPGDPKDCQDLWEYQNMTFGQGRSGGTGELLRVKFSEQEKVCHSDYFKSNF